MTRVVKRCTRSARRWREQFDVEDEERRACDRADCGGGERRRAASAVCVRQLCAYACACTCACGAARSGGPDEVQPHPDGRAVRASAAQRRPPQHWRV